MAKHKRKIQEALLRRISNWKDPNPTNGMKAHKPGSQNKRKTGYGKGSTSR